jgi:hypothetical protein
MDNLDDSDIDAVAYEWRELHGSFFFQNLNFRLQISDVGICQQNVES